jgi:Carboxypeptidase regulatory-like domain/TonB dependent receptor
METMQTPKARLVVLIILTLLTRRAALADVGGKITGMVKDQTGAAIAGITVTVVNTATRAQQTTKTDTQGVYSFPALSVGQYQVDVTADGFNAYRKTGLVIDINSFFVVDVILQVGRRSEAVTVTESSETIQVEKADTELGQTINEKRITEVPLNGRSYTDLLATQTGVTPVTTSATSSTSSGGGFGAIAPSGGLNPGEFSVNGQRESANGFVLNGANVEEAVSEGAAIVPNLDSIAEFRILTSNFDAEYGNYSGGLVSVVTKTGANQFHGSVFEFLRNTNLDARGFFDLARPQFNQNQYGGTLGGPVKKDKLFFFGDFQGSRTVQGLETGILPVPSLQDRQGNLSDAANSLTGTVTSANLATVLTKQLGYTVSQNEPYYTAGCTLSSQCVLPNAVIPQNGWSVPAQSLLQYIPRPNVGLNEFSTASLAERLNDIKGSVRLDANTGYGAVAAYYTLDNYHLNNPYPTQQGGANVPGSNGLPFNALSDGQAQLIDLSDTKTLGATAVNEFRFSYMRDNNDLGPQQGGVGVSLASQGFTVGAEGIVPGAPDAEGVESIVFNKITFGTSPFSLLQTNNSYQYQDNFSKVIGNHTAKCGGQFLDQTVKLVPDFTANGQFQFIGSATGLDFADFLLGLPTQYNQGFSPPFHDRTRYAGAYAQDSWRIKPNLTLNYGVRWDVVMPWYEQNNQTGTLIQGEQSEVFPGAPAGYVFPGDPGVPRTIAPTRYNNFSPRLGLAYSPSWTEGILGKLSGGPGKSSLRAGYGRFFTAIEGQTLAFETGNSPYGLTYSSPEQPLFQMPFIGAITGTQYLQQFPVNVPPYDASQQHPDTSVDWADYEPINGIDAFSPTNKTPYSEQYFLSLQRQFGENTVLTASLIGSQGHHLIVLLPANPGNPALCLSLAGCGPFDEHLYNTRQPFGANFGSDVYFDAMGNAVYNSLQVTLQHTSGRFTVLGSYTYGKSLDQASSLGEQVDPYNYKLTRDISSFDLRQNFVATYRYDLPFEKVLGHDNRWTQGWAISGVTRFTTGVPVTLVNPNDTSLIGTGNNGVNNSTIDELKVSAGSLQINHDPRNRQPYFNTALFSLPALGTIGNSGRRSFYGPGMQNWDMALLKTTKLTESKSLEFRFEAFNAFNHAQFFGATSVDGNIDDATFGHVISADAPRIAQAALKFHF